MIVLSKSKNATPGADGWSLMGYLLHHFPEPVDAVAAAKEDIPHFYVRNIGMPNIIGVLVGLVSHGG
jgi:hypothetical protein